MEGREIRFEESPSRGRYWIELGKGDTAEITFSKAGAGQIIIDHTSVPRAFREEGLALRLVTRAVEDARAAGKTVIPLCSYAAAQFRAHPEWSDLLAARVQPQT